MAVIVLMLLLVAQLTYLQVIDAKQLADDPRNSRTYLKDFTRPRGEIISADGKILARSIPSKDEYERQRVYPYGELFAQTVGYQSVVVGSTGVEKEYTAVLSGRDRSRLRLKDLGDLLLGKEQTGNVVLSLRTDVQLVAKAALGNQQGSVVVMDPKTGALIAMYSNPSFDPQPLAGHDPKAVQAYWRSLEPDSPDTTLLPRAYRQRYPPGSTFKIATTEAALDTGLATPQTPFPAVSSFLAPQAGQAIANFGGESCGGTLEESFVHSCNTTFAKLGLDLGEQFPPKLAGFGIYAAPPIDLSPGAAESSGPVPGTFNDNKPQFALAGIGQGEVAATPLQMALIGADGGQRRDRDAAPRRSRDPRRRRQAAQHRHPEVVEGRDADHDRGDDPRLHGPGRRARHRHRGPDRGRFGRRQDRNRPELRWVFSPRVVRGVRAGRGPPVRGGGVRGQGREHGERGDGWPRRRTDRRGSLQVPAEQVTALRPGGSEDPGFIKNIRPFPAPNRADR